MSSASSHRTVPRSLTILLALLGHFAFTILAADLENPTLPPPVQRAVDFEKDVKPIFAAHCIKCHGPDKQKGEFRLDRKESALKGGENPAPDIRPGHSAESPLIRFVSG